MTNPNDPWARRPDDDPTQRLGQPGESATEKIPSGDMPGYVEPTTAYPGTDPYGGWGPGPNPTREMPTYDSYAYGAQGGMPGPGPQDPYGRAGGALPPGPPGEPPRRPSNKNGIWLGVGLAAIVLIALAAVGAGMMFGGGGDSQNTAGDSATTSRPLGREIPMEPEESAPALPSLPGMPDSGSPDDPNAGGTTMGTISSNTAGTLTLSTLTGEQVTVHTTPSTQVISLSGTTVDALPAGDLVIVQGQQAPDKSIQADVIISTALDGGGR
ncbi:DUF5666 domain-containing protein [Nocardia sp. NPDC019395]|uniref:DUF5666 domain-containing protein n=1 Tax=Nocardia sp. NPDC019395 TaxID=3154686 RepID=UPI0033D5DC9F